MKLKLRFILLATEGCFFQTTNRESDIIKKKYVTFNLRLLMKALKKNFSFINCQLKTLKSYFICRFYLRVSVVNYL